MSDAADIAGLTVALHEERQHTALTASVERLLGELERVCADAEQARAELAAHLASYHAPEPEPEPEASEEEETPEEAPPPEEKEPEPEPAPEPERIPENTHVILRGVLNRG